MLLEESFNFIDTYYIPGLVGYLNPFKFWAYVTIRKILVELKGYPHAV